MKKFLKTWLLITALSTAACAPAFADDIEVFGSGGGVKPNILFVFDRSGSMKNDIYGAATSDWNSRRSTILQTAFAQLLETHKENINAGLGPFYRTRTSGVKWPIGSLTQNAHEIDPDIPVDSGMTTQTVIDRLFDSSSDWGNTNILDALYESALYFRGEEVNPTASHWATFHQPGTWDANSERYLNDYYSSAHPATYTPQNAFVEDDPEASPQTGTCRDYTIAGYLPDAANECDNSSYSSYDSCTLVDAVPGEGTTCLDWKYTCNTTNVDGRCIDGQNICELEGPTPDTPEYNLCTYYKPKDSWAGATYNSPIADSCQSNYIILFSDGDPTQRYAQEDVKTLTGDSTCQDLSTGIFSAAEATDANDGDCAIELATFLANNDQIDTIPDSTIKTYTIGFGVEGPGQDYLDAIATAGDGQFFPASDAAGLASAFDSVLNAISAETEAFAAVSVDVNKANFSSDNRAFFSLFLPDSRRSWLGNLKGYFIDQAGILDLDGNNAITQTENGAVFSASSRSFWSTTADGNEVAEGGGAGKIDAETRNLFTFTGASVPISGTSLLDADNLLHKDNTKITPEMLDGADPSVIDALYSAPMADPLHTQPVSIKYTDRTVVYTMTNQGLLHAFDASNPLSHGDVSGGNELWAFMPQVLLKNLAALKANQTTGRHIYGLDGGMTRWLDETGEADGIISTGENAILYIGMRRGGSNYYAIDVSDPDAPRLKWQIEGGTENFKKLGQSWSRMALSTMKDSGTEKKVLIFAGGYDEQLDGSTTRMSTTAAGDAITGNDIYIVDAIYGEVIWSANNESTELEMNYAIPADLNVIDTDSDGLADRLYFADLGGQLWRADFPQGEAAYHNSVSLEVIANLGDGIDHHPFFYPPSVALMRGRRNYFFAISIGSGTRDHPLDPDSNNAIFMIRDNNTDPGPPADVDQWPIKPGDLYDATENLVGSADAEEAQTARTSLEQAQGWTVKLESGEKALATTTIFQNDLYFTTYLPTNGEQSDDPCAASGSIGRYYRMDAASAAPVEKLAGDDASAARTNGGYLKGDRSKDISTHGIPGAATIVFPSDSTDVQVYVAQQKVGTIEERVVKTLWYDRQ